MDFLKNIGSKIKTAYDNFGAILPGWAQYQAYKTGSDVVNQLRQPKQELPGTMMTTTPKAMLGPGLTQNTPAPTTTPSPTASLTQPKPTPQVQPITTAANQSALSSMQQSGVSYNPNVALTQSTSNLNIKQAPATIGQEMTKAVSTSAPYNKMNEAYDMVRQALQPTNDVLDAQKELKNVQLEAQKVREDSAARIARIEATPGISRDFINDQIRAEQERANTQLANISAREKAISSAITGYKQTQSDYVQNAMNYAKAIGQEVVDTQINPLTGEAFAIMRDPVSGAFNTVNVGNVGATKETSGLTEVSPGATLYDPRTGQAVFTAPSKVAASVASGNNLSSKQTSNLLTVTTKYQADPIINTAIKGQTAVQVANQVLSDPSNATNQLKSLYVLVKNLDPDSAVREGEISLANQTQSYLQQFSNSLARIAEGRVISPDAAVLLANATIDLSNAWNETAARRQQQYTAQADVVGIGDAFSEYLALSGTQQSMQQNNNNNESQITVISPDGEEGTIPLSQLEDAISEGYTIMQ